MKYKKKLLFHTDAGHGWLAVPLQELTELEIAQHISPYSYMAGQSAYLEEDQDAGIYLDAREAAGIDAPEIVTCYKDRSPIRSHAGYKPPRKKETRARLHNRITGKVKDFSCSSAHLAEEEKDALIAQWREIEFNMFPAEDYEIIGIMSEYC